MWRFVLLCCRVEYPKRRFPSFPLTSPSRLILNASRSPDPRRRCRLRHLRGGRRGPPGVTFFLLIARTHDGRHRIRMGMRSVSCLAFLLACLLVVIVFLVVDNLCYFCCYYFCCSLLLFSFVRRKIPLATTYTLNP